MIPLPADAHMEAAIIRTSSRKAILMSRTMLVLMGLLLGDMLAGRALAAEPAPGGIREMRRLENSVARLGGDGDNFYMSWGKDGRLFAGLCDGNAEPWADVPRKLFNSRLIEVNGEPPKLSFRDVPGYPELLVGPGPRNVSRYYGFGI